MRDQEVKIPMNGSDAGVRTAWGLIDWRPLIRDALIGIMQQVGAPPVIGAASADEFLDCVAHSDARISLVMLHIGNGIIDREQFLQEYALLRKTMPDIPVAVLGERVDVNGIGHILRVGARGYIPTSWSSAEVIQALKRVEAGAVHVPADMLPHLFETFHSGRHAGNNERMQEKRKFTPRQLEVLRLVRQGKPNKIIAYELDMQESTVKVHVREIMKKLKVSNRTQAAFRAGQLLAELDNHDAGGMDRAVRPAG